MFVIAFSDLHLREGTEEICFRILEGIGALAEDEPDQRIVCCGDFWHIRYQIDVRLLNRAKDLVSSWVTKHGLQVDLLPGNHDQVDINGENALRVLAGEGVKVWTKAGYDGYAGFVPYEKDPGALYQTFKRIEAEGPSIIFGHFGVRGATLNSGTLDDDGLDLGNEGCPIILGHYHRRQKIGRCQYLGSPYQQNFGEAGNPYGVARIRPEGVTFLPAFSAPEHHIIKWDPDAQPLPTWRFNPQDKIRLDIILNSSVTRKDGLREMIKDTPWENSQINILAQPEARDTRFSVTAGESLLSAAQRFTVERLGSDNAKLEQALVALKGFANG